MPKCSVIPTRYALDLDQYHSPGEELLAKLLLAVPEIFRYERRARVKPSMAPAKITKSGKL